MKKTLLTLAIMLLGLGAAKAQEEIGSIQFVKSSTDYSKTSSYSSTWGSTDEKWSFTALNNNNNGWDFIAAGWTTAATTPSFYTGPYSVPVSKIVISIGSRYTASAITSAKLYISDSNDFSEAIGTDLTLPTAANTDWTITIPTPAENKYYKVGLEVPKQSKNGYAISFTKITVYGKSDKAEANYAFSKATVNLPYGSDFEAPTFTCAEGAPAPTYSSSDESVATVNSTTGEVQIIGLGTTEISAKSESTDKFLAGNASYTLNVLKVVNSIAETMEVTDKTEKLYINYPLTVAFKNFNNNFVCNGDDFIQIYGSQPDYKVGDVIPAGWVGCYDLYNGVTPEILTPTDMQAATENNGFTPAKANYSDVTAADVNKVLTFENVTIAEATPAGKDYVYGTVDGNPVTFYNNYSVASVEPGVYNITGVVTIYKNAPSIYVVSYEKAVDTGIADIVADENAPVEYFNLQGIRVANPENGLYIRRQGNKVTKVIVK